MEVKKKYSSFEYEFRYIFKVFEYFGLQNFSGDQISNLSEKPSKFRLFYMIFRMVTGVTIMILYIMTMQSKQDNEFSNDLMVFIQKTMNVGFIISVIVSTFQSYWSTDKMKQIYINCKKILFILNNDLNIDLNFHKIKRIIYLRLFIMCTSAAGFYFIIGSLEDYQNLAFFLGFTPIFFFILSVFHYIFFVDISYNFLAAIAKYMKRLSFENNVIEIMTIDNRKVLHVKPTDNSLENLRTLKLCRTIYSLLHQNCSHINCTYGISLLVTLINILIALTVSGYKLFILVVEKKEFQSYLGKNIKYKILI